MYLRIVVGLESDSPRKLVGLFTEVTHLKNNNILFDYEVDLANQIFDFYNENLPCPPFQNSKWSIKAVSWFKDSATEFINKMWDLAAILEQNGLHIRILKTDKPGMILYEDEYQIVAQDRIH